MMDKGLFERRSLKVVGRTSGGKVLRHASTFGRASWQCGQVSM